MAFDWGRFLQGIGGSVQQAGNTAFTTYLREQEAEKKAARDLEMFRQQSQIEQDIWQQRTERNEEFKKQMVEINSEAQKDYDIAAEERVASLSRFYGDPEIQRELESYIAGKDTRGATQGMVMQNLLKKARRGEEFNQQDMVGLSMLGFATQSKLNEINFANIQTEREFQMKKKSAGTQEKMYTALTNMYDEQVASAQRPDPAKSIAMINAATKIRQSILEGEEYMYLKGLSGGEGRKKQKITKGQEATLRGFEQNLQITEMVIQFGMSGLQQQPVGQGGQMPPGAPQPLPPAQQPPAQQPGAIDQLGGAVGVARQSFEDRATEVFGELAQKRVRVSRKERKEMEQAAREFRVDPDYVVHIDDVVNSSGGYFQGELMDLQKKGVLVYMDGKFHRIVQVGGKLGLVPIRE